jgi:hypothetical protein
MMNRKTLVKNWMKLSDTPFPPPRIVKNTLAVNYVKATSTMFTCCTVTTAATAT